MSGVGAVCPSQLCWFKEAGLGYAELSGIDGIARTGVEIWYRRYSGVRHLSLEKQSTLAYQDKGILHSNS